MSTHTVSENAHPLTINLFVILKHRLWQLGRDIAVHFIAFRPWFFGGIDVETGTGAKIIGVVFALDFEATLTSTLAPLLFSDTSFGWDRTRTGIRIKHRYPLLTSRVLKEPFFCAIVSGACETGEVDE